MSGFYDKYWGAREGGGHLSDFVIKWPKISKYIPRETGITIVDFGCGQGDLMKEMKKINPLAEYIGLDVSKDALERARASFPGAEFHSIVDGAPLPLQSNSADFVFSSEVIEHVYDTENAFTEIIRILKPGGRALITTPYHGMIKNLALTIFAFDKHFNPFGPHIRFFSKKKLFDAIQKMGGRVLKHGHYGRFFPLPHSIFVIFEKPAHSRA